MKQGFMTKLIKNNMILIFAYALSIVIMVLVYMTGGTTKVYSHLMYVPIAAVSSAYGKRKGIFHAALSALLLGPFMPLNVNMKIAQEPINWITRLLIFIIVSLIIGFFSDYNRKHRDLITSLLTHDVNTGLKNLEAIKHEDGTDESDKTIVALIIKNFDEMMSFFGYIFSNQITLKIANKLSETLKQYNNVELYKYSGMQFVLKITNSSTGADADEIIAAIAGLNKSVLVVESIPIYLELQMGITSISGSTSTFEGLRQAFIAYSYAKSNDLKSSNFELTLESHYKSILDIAGGFSAALASHSIDAAYQRVVSAKTDETHSVELLARWKKEDGEYIRPDLFIPIIEKTELIKELTKYIISRAIEFLKVHSKDDWIVSINFSLKDFTADSIEYLFRAIEAANINPGRIQIEVIERTLADVKDLNQYLVLLREHNIKIALDDFGTGYSSYQYLGELPIDVIKIDKSIIFKIDKNEASRSLAKSIVNFCAENKIITVAEGVETKEIADVCKEIGIDYLQGFYYHRPQII